MVYDMPSLKEPVDQDIFPNRTDHLRGNGTKPVLGKRRRLLFFLFSNSINMFFFLFEFFFLLLFFLCFLSFSFFFLSFLSPRYHKITVVAKIKSEVKNI